MFDVAGHYFAISGANCTFRSYKVKLIERLSENRLSKQLF